VTFFIAELPKTIKYCWFLPSIRGNSAGMDFDTMFMVLSP